MRKLFHALACTYAGLSICAQLQAQKPGNPQMTAPPQTISVEKSSSPLHPELQKLVDNLPGARRTLSNSARQLLPNDAMNNYLQFRGNSVVVDITVKENMTSTRASLEQIGLKVTGVFGRVISGLIPVDALSQLSAIPSVQFARPAFKPMRLSQQLRLAHKNAPSFYNATSQAPVISQGDTAQRSYIARKKYAVSGKSVKVGILSDSYDNLGTAATGVLRGELPGPGNPFGYKKPVEVLEDLNDSSGTDEGRGMAEIIHDVAPGAELAFHTAFLGEADFAQGIQDLAQKNCKVIVDDIFYYDEPFFQDGIIAQSVDLAKKKGVSYFSSAGNNFNSSYESDYRPSAEELLGPGNGTAHNFSAPGSVPRYYQPVYIPPGGTFIASFQWDQPFFSAGGTGASSDFDMYLLDVNGRVVALGASDNINSGDPAEVFGYTNHSTNYTFFVVILKFAGPDPTRLKYNMYGDAQFYLTTPAIPGLLAPTLVGHAKAEGAIATAAAFYLNTPAYAVDTPKVEWFSSLAGVPNYFDVAGNRIAPLYRKKPELTAPDGGNTSFFDPYGNGDIKQDADSFPNFFGTSAAAPHAAGVAALMLEAERLHNLTPGQVKGIMMANTVDMDNIYTPGFDKGFDLNTGTGLIKADGIVGSVSFPALYIKNLKLQSVCSPNPGVTRSWKIINPNPFDVEAHWLLLGTNQHGSFTAAPGETIISTNTFSYGYFQLPNVVILDWNDNFGFTRLDLENSNSTACGNANSRGGDIGAGESLPKPMVADVFPNPSSSTFRVYLALADEQPVDLQLFSIDGKKLLEKRVPQSRGIIPIDASPYKAGVYLLQVKQGAFNKTIKLIKQ